MLLSPRIVAWLGDDFLDFVVDSKMTVSPMILRSRYLSILASSACFALTVGQIHAETNAILRLRPDGPLAPIHAIEFSADGSDLFTAGDDKLVQVYTLNAGKFARYHSRSLRPTIGPGPLGSIRTLSLSDDGRFAVTGGVGTFDQQAGYSQDGILIPSFGWSQPTLDQVGSVTLFDVQAKQARTIKTHPGYVSAAKIVSTANAKQSFLVTIGNDEDPRQCGDAETSTEDSTVRSVRVFQLPGGEQLHRWPLSQTAIQPTLTAWCVSGATDSNALRVAVTAADGNPGGGIDVYRTDSDQPIRFADTFALAADRIGVTNQLCVASRQAVSIIDADDCKLIKRVNLSGQILQSEFIFAVRTLRLRPDVVAVTIRDLAKPDSDHRLNFIDLKTDRLLLDGGIPLGNRQNPVIGADPSGRFVAATADVTAGVKIVEIAAVDQAKATIFQTLKPDFQPVTRAALVANGDNVTLRFSILNDDKTETYDFVEDRLRRVEAAKFTSFDQPINFTRSAGKNEFVSHVTLDNVVIGSIAVETTSMPVAKVIRSERLGGRPLAAVAFVPYGGAAQARLSIYDPKTGKEVRRLNGHEQIVTGIEFSNDDRHLTSVSADGMVCVWNLTDLSKLIGRRSVIEDTDWCLRDGQIVIASVEAGDGNPQPDGLQAGDRVIGFYNGKKELVKTASTEDLFRGLSYSLPGSDVAVRVERSGREIDAKVRLGQAADERKPLFSFICAARKNAKIPDWLAWSPSGPFQSSGPEIESSAGWHFNPVRAGDAVKFAPFAEYRDEFSGKTLIKNLLAMGRLPSVWPPAMNADISVRFVDRKDRSIYLRDGGYRSDEPLKRMQVLITGTPNQSIAEVVGNIDSGRPIELKQSLIDPNIWEYEDDDLAELTSRHDISVTVRGDRLHDGFQRESFDVVAGEDLVTATGGLPNVRVLSHAGSSTMRRAELMPGDRVRIEAMVDAESIAPEHHVEVLRDGKTLALEATETIGNHFSATVPLVVGKNPITVRLSKDDGSKSTATFAIEVIDPILISSLTGKLINRNLSQLSLRLRSDRQILRNYIHVLVDGTARDDFEFGKPTPVTGAAEPGTFDLVLSQLALPEGEHEVEVATTDNDGHVWDHRAVTLVVLPEPEQPKLELSIADGTIVDASQLDLAIQIESDDLKVVEVRIGDRMVPVEFPKAGRDGVRLTSADLPLARGVNQVAVTAISEAGLMTTVRRQINRIDRPVGVSAERIVMDGDLAFELVAGPEGSLQSSGPLPAAIGTIEGRVRLSSTSAPITAGENVIAASVNGFLQSVIPLKAIEGSDELSFRIPVTLSSTSNDIRLSLPGLVESENSVASISVACENPSRDQTLHLLVISTRVSWRERKTYERSVLELLGIANEKMPAFSRVVSGSPIYPALTGEVSRSDNVRPLIEQCRFELSDKQGVNNTVLIYFHGEEMRSEEGQLCLMTADARPERAFTDPTLITSAYLAEQFKDLKCANLLFLDVTEHVSSFATPFAGDPTHPSLGVLRLVQGGARRKTPTPELLSHISKVLPRVSEIGQLAQELEVEVNPTTGLAVTESIPEPIRWMRFGALTSP